MRSIFVRLLDQSTILLIWASENLLRPALYPTLCQPQQLQSFQITKENCLLGIAWSVYPSNHIQWSLKAQPQRTTSLYASDQAKTKTTMTFQAGAHWLLRVVERSLLKSSIRMSFTDVAKLALMQAQMTVRLSLLRLPVPCQLRAATGCCRRSMAAIRRQKQGEFLIFKLL